MLKAAIAHGMAAPWMYEALAIAQEASGADKEEIRRTLLSAADVVHDSADAQYRVARLLARHNLKESAIRLYRQAAQQAPFATEPYTESLALAVQIDDVQTVRWAASKLLGEAWIEANEELHRLARTKLLEMDQKLRSAGRQQEAAELLAAVRAADTHDLMVHATWDGDADVDLVVVEPLGTHCSVNNRRTPAGGVLVKDGFGKHAEELYICSRGLPGPYEIRVRRVWGTPDGRKVRIEVVRGMGTPQEKRSTHYLTVEAERPLLVQLDSGRRQELLSIPQALPTALSSAERDLPIQKLKAMAERMDKKFDGATALFQFGGGAVAFDPVVSDFFDGAGLGVQAIVSPDRRYVRLQLMPFITDLVGERRFPITGTARQP